MDPSDEAPGDPAAYALAWDEGRHAVAEQTAALRDLRDRAGTLVSVVGLVVGLGVSFVLDDGRGQRLDELGVIGAVFTFGGFALVVLAAARIWAPLVGNFVRDPSDIVDYYIEDDTPLALPAIHRELVWHLGNDARDLRDKLEARLTWFTRSLRALLAVHGGLAAMILDVCR